MQTHKESGLAVMDINRLGNNEEDTRIDICIKLSMGKSLTVSVTPENLALALTGRSEIPVTFKTRNIGIIQFKKGEIKE